MKKLQLKVCGLRFKENIEQIQEFDLQYLGFIHYSKSPRYVESIPEFEKKPSIERVGVFVNEEVDVLISWARKNQIKILQLHGDEKPETCQILKSKGFEVWKAFGIQNEFEWTLLEKYAPFVDSFLFDTYSKNYGGTGQKFSWTLLDNYTLEVPFWLSGGIGPEELLNFDFGSQHPLLRGLDWNSKFESSPGVKQVELLKNSIENFRKNEQIYG